VIDLDDFQNDDACRVATLTVQSAFTALKLSHEAQLAVLVTGSAGSALALGMSELETAQLMRKAYREAVAWARKASS
jgi:hypothetical protein